MKNITAKEHFGYAVTIRRLFEGCTNEFGEPCFTNKETGEIRCFGGKLNPRPSYQREFVYSEQDQKKVFETLYRAFPLGTMYWCDTGDGSYELIDGQQRTISILNILTDGVSISMYGEDKFFSDLPESEQEQILDQELLVYVCSGDASEKLDWFSTISRVKHLKRKNYVRQFIAVHLSAMQEGILSATQKERHSQMVMTCS